MIWPSGFAAWRAGAIPLSEEQPTRIIGSQLYWRVLAADTEHLDLHVFLICKLMLTHRHLALRFLDRREGLLSEVGVTYRPATATELVRWLIWRTMDDSPEGRPGSDQARKMTLAVLSPNRAGRMRAYPAGSFVSAAIGLSTWIGIVAPVISVWEIGRAIGQWRDGAAPDGQVIVPATVISAVPIGSVRHSQHSL